jgi:hypothetical protein
MNSHADKTQKDRHQTVANAVSQKQSGREPAFQFADNRPETVAQRKLQEMANNSPQVKQLRTTQEMADNSPQMGVVQRVCYSIADGDNETGNEDPGSDFPGEVADAYYQIEADLRVTSHEADRDEETNEAITRQRQLTPVIGNIDHIVPANLGGGGLEGNSRALRADHNQQRQDDFGRHNTNHPLRNVRVVHNGEEYTTSQEAIDNGATDEQIDALIDGWNDPWGVDGPLNDNRPVDD